MNQKHINQLIDTALAIEAEDAKHAGALGFMARVLAQVTLPYRAQPDNEFTRRNGALELTVVSPKSVGLPYGSYPRLLLSWVTTEAVRTRSPVLELGPTLSAFMAELGLIPSGGKEGTIPRLRNQTERLFSSSISCRYKDEAHTKGAGFNIASNYDLWWNPKLPDQLPLWKSTVTLGSDFFKEIVERPVPVDIRALKGLKRSPMALDIYCWLAHRMSYLRKDTVIPWHLLQLQFGADYTLTRQFKAAFLKQLKAVHTIYPAAKIAEVDRGLLLKPSPPHVATMPEPLRTLEKQWKAPLLPSPSPEPPAIRLKTTTFEKAKQAAPGFDVYYLEQEWREWIAKKGERPEHPDAAFIGFCRRKAQPKTT